MPPATQSPNDLRSELAQRCARPGSDPRADWAFEYVTTTLLSFKVSPPALPPADASSSSSPRPAPSAPGRPPQLTVAPVAPKSPKLSSLGHPRQRARLFHTFWHHELQAAELMCWAYLKFDREAPEFRSGLLRICLDEIRHMRMYERHLEHLGYPVGSFEVRDWFWKRVPSASSAISFVAVMGLGLEAANLEHSERYATALELAGDPIASEIQRTVGREETSHVAFGRYWFERWQGELSFDAWQRHLPPPLSPLLMRGMPLNREARRQAKLPEQFLDALAAWRPE